MSYLVGALLLLLLGCIFLGLEFFIPSSGTLGILAALSLSGAIVSGFMAGPMTGMTMLIAVLVIVPVAIVAAIKWWPDTPIGKLILIQRPESPDSVLPETEAYRGLNQWIGKRGHAKSLMLPSGVVQIDHRTFDAVSEGTVIELGSPIVVVGVSMQRIVVRLDDSPIPAELSSPQVETPPISDGVAQAPDASRENVLKDFDDPFKDEPSAR